MSYEQPPPPGGYGYGVGPGYGDAPPPGNNQKAVWSLVLGIIGLLCCGPLTIAAIVLGNLAKAETAASGQAGGGMAQAGFVLGILGLVLWLMYVVLVATGVITLPSAA